MNKTIRNIAATLMSLEVLAVTFVPAYLGFSANKIAIKKDSLVKQGISPKRFEGMDLACIGNPRTIDSLNTIQDSLNNRRFDSLDLREKGKIPTKKILDSMQNIYKETRFPL